MNKDRAEGKTKDIAGRIERQVGEWTGDKDHEAQGVAKQVEGKVQSAWGKVKDGAKDVVEKAKTPRHDRDDRDRETSDEVSDADRPTRRTA